MSFCALFCRLTVQGSITITGGTVKSSGHFRHTLYFIFCPSYVAFPAETSLENTLYLVLKILTIPRLPSSRLNFLDRGQRLAPKLCVMASTSLGSMVPITALVNTNKSHNLSSDLFDRELVAYIQDLLDENGNVPESEYFSREDRQGMT